MDESEFIGSHHVMRGGGGDGMDHAMPPAGLKKATVRRRYENG
jgi:hypothetical protein